MAIHNAHHTNITLPVCRYYGDLLGSRIAFVREMTAKAFCVLLRKLSTKVFVRHFKKLLKALALNCKRIYSSINKEDKDGIYNNKNAEFFIINEMESKTAQEMDKADNSDNNKSSVERVECLVDGIVRFHR